MHSRLLYPLNVKSQFVFYPVDVNFQFHDSAIKKTINILIVNNCFFSLISLAKVSLIKSSVKVELDVNTREDNVDIEADNMYFLNEENGVAKAGVLWVKSDTLMFPCFSQGITEDNITGIHVSRLMFSILNV